MNYFRLILVTVIIALCPFTASSVHANGARSCGADNGVSTIEIEVPGSGAVPADQVMQLIAKPRNSAGEVVGASITWSVSNGSIDWTGLFSPWQKGEIIVTACSGNAWVNQSVTVLQGDTVSVDLQLSSYEVSTDDLVILDPRRVDSKGNSAPAYVPSENWSIPEGTSIHHGSDVKWEPMQTGTFTLAISAYGFHSNATLNVTYGKAVDLKVVGSTNISTDESSFYEVNACDSKDNCWSIDGNWSFIPDGKVQLFNDSQGVFLSPKSAGVVRLLVSCEVDDIALSSHKDIRIIHGEPVQTKVEYFDGNHSGTFSSSVIQVKAGVILELSVSLLDAVGSEWKSEEVVWKVNQSGNSQYEVFTSSSYNFSSNRTGEWNLEIRPTGGIPSKYSIEVIPGDAAMIEVSSTTSTAMRVSAGGSIGLQVIAKDIDHNAFPLDVEWLMSEEVGIMSKDTSGSGSYVFTPSRNAYLGTQILNFSSPLGIQNIAIELVAGELAELAIVFEDDSSGEQGDELIFLIQGRDSNGNHIQVSLNSVNVECSCGKVTSLGDGKYKVDLDEYGERHTLSAQMDGLPRKVVYVDVSETIFSGLLGSNSQVISMGIVVTGLLLLFMAITIYRKSKSESEEESEDADDESLVNPPTYSAQAPLKAPQVSAFGVLTHPPPLSAQPLPQIPPPVSTTASQPALHYSPQTSHPVEIQSAVKSENLIGGYGVTSVSEYSATAPVVDEKPSLSSAKELLAPQSIVSENKEQPSSASEIGSVPEQVLSEVTVDEKSVEKSEELVVKEMDDSQFAESSKEDVSMTLLPSPQGPMTTAGVLLQPLPGTEPGKEGWYRGIDARPFYWKGPQ